ncbi:MAG: heme-dependent oxidative N-demethylase subunit alpha family protein [Actinomycetota bacterium]
MAAGGPEWFDELDLEPDFHPVSMGTRALGARPWLMPDGNRDRELAEKADSLTHRRDEVAWFTNESRDVAEAVRRLISSCGFDPVAAASSDHPLEAAALSVQEDLCLLRRIDGRWHFDASVVCFPTHWHLPSKIGRPIGAVHDPVAGYHERIADKVTRLFDRVGERPVLRRNFGLTEDTALFQPAYRTSDPDIQADRVMEALFIRSERQTLRAVGEGWLLFTIRVQMASLAELLTNRERTERFRRWVAEVPPTIAPRRHLGEAQRATLLSRL